MPNTDTKTSSPSKLVTSSAETEPKKAFYSNEEKPTGLFSTLPYYILIFLYAFVWYTIEKWHQPWLGSFVLFSFVPLLDVILPEDWLNPTDKQTKKLADDVFFKFPLYAGVITCWVYHYWVLNHLAQHDFGLFYTIGVLFISGGLLAANFPVCHELFHKQEKFDRLLGGLALVPLLYTHYFIEHQYGHHRHVATPSDGAYSKLGESVYDNVPRAIKRVFFSTWEIEKRRLLEIEECSTHWHPKNRMIWYVLGYPTFLALVYSKFGFCGMGLTMYLAFQAIVFLESINYVEHYALERKEIAPGEYEKVNITHSWNAPHRFSNYLLFKVQRHSDHHENGYKPYQTLASYDESPTLPNGYAFCVTLCFFPMFWFNTINPYVIKSRKGEKITAAEQANAKKWMNMFLGLVTTVFGLLMVLGFIFKP